MKHKLFAGMILTCLAVPSFAEEGGYFGLGWSQISYAEDGYDTVSPTAIIARLGKQVNPNLAIEARLGTGLASSDIYISNVRVSVDVDSFIGFYGKVMAPVSPQVSVYGLLGYTSGKLTLKASNGYSSSADDSDISYGMGAEFAVTPQSSVGVEWAHLMSGSGYDVKAITVGANFKF